jgi:hypothetical protein
LTHTLLRLFQQNKTLRATKESSPLIVSIELNVSRTNYDEPHL